MEVCQNCGHAVPLALRELIRWFGELYPIEEALTRLRCDECQATKVKMNMARLCEPGCRYWSD